MKKRIILACVAIAFLAVGCNKKKNCQCTISQVWRNIGEPMITTVQTEIDKGDCSDLNMTQTMQAGGDTYEQITECVEI